MNVTQGRSNWYANFQFKLSQVMVAVAQLHVDGCAILMTVWADIMLHSAT